jgi:hypothetical protein
MEALLMLEKSGESRCTTHLFDLEMKLRIRLSASYSALLIVVLFAACSSGQVSTIPLPPATNPQLNVNWLYGAYVPKDAPLESLTDHQRFQLYLRQTFTTPGIYAKTAMFSIGDQINDNPAGWGDDFGGYLRRLGSRHGQFVVQNSFSALGNAALGLEPRYDRCRCSKWLPRTGHAILRNFVTYNSSEKAMRPQIAMYAGAFGGGVVAGTWKPQNRDLVADGYHSMITQAGFGIAANLIGEFAPEIRHLLGGKKHKSEGK